jgi:hypothetical protein
MLWAPLGTEKPHGVLGAHKRLFNRPLAVPGIMDLDLQPLGPDTHVVLLRNPCLIPRALGSADMVVPGGSVCE